MFTMAPLVYSNARAMAGFEPQPCKGVAEDTNALSLKIYSTSSLLFHLPCSQFHRIIESQDGFGWKGPSEAI